MVVAEELRMYEQVRSRQKETGTSGYVHVQVFGDDFTQATGKYNKKVRIIDRRNDRYYERVTNSETGEVMHLRDEKLSEHFGAVRQNFSHTTSRTSTLPWPPTSYGRRKGVRMAALENHWEMAIEDLRRSAAGVKTLYS